MIATAVNADLIVEWTYIISGGLGVFGLVALYLGLKQCKPEDKSTQDTP